MIINRLYSAQITVVLVLIFPLMLKSQIKTTSPKRIEMWRVFPIKKYYINSTNDTIFSCIYNNEDSSYITEPYIFDGENWVNYYKNTTIHERGKFKKKYHGKGFFLKDLLNLGSIKYKAKHGVWEIYSKDGLLQKRITYNRGDIIKTEDICPDSE